MDGASWHCTEGRLRPSPKEEMQKGKMVVWGGLINSWEKKRHKRQRKKERGTHLNAEFQRIARRDKKAFLSDQCKEIEENNRMEKIRDRLKKIKRYQGNILCKHEHDKGQKEHGPNRSRSY